MAKKKSNKIIGSFKIFFSGINSYFMYFEQCMKYLAFPVLGQLVGIAVIFTLTYYFSINFDNLKNISPFFENERNLYIVFTIVMLPFLLITLKAVYDYIIAFSALNILFFTVSGKKKVKDIDFKANKKVIERKLPAYIMLILAVTLLLITPPLIFIAPVLWIFLSLVFQVFALENDNNPFKAISRSIELVKGNVIATIILLVSVTLLTYWYLPALFVWAAGKISLTSFLFDKIEAFSMLLPLTEINNMLAIVNFSIDPTTIAKFMSECTISSLVIAFTLPYRCCCFTELYKLYDYERIKDFSKDTDEIITRATSDKKRKN